MRSAAKQAGFEAFFDCWTKLRTDGVKQVCLQCPDFTGITYQELDERLENDPNIVVCWK